MKTAEQFYRLVQLTENITEAVYISDTVRDINSDCAEFAYGEYCYDNTFIGY